MDEILDKLDGWGVEEIIKVVGGDKFGEMFIRDRNGEDLDGIVDKVGSDYKMLGVEKGKIWEMVEREVGVGEENEG